MFSTEACDTLRVFELVKHKKGTTSFDSNVLEDTFNTVKFSSWIIESATYQNDKVLKEKN